LSLAESSCLWFLPLSPPVRLFSFSILSAAESCSLHRSSPRRRLSFFRFGNVCPMLVPSGPKTAPRKGEVEPTLRSPDAFSSLLIPVYLFPCPSMGSTRFPFRFLPSPSGPRPRVIPYPGLSTPLGELNYSLVDASRFLLAVFPTQMHVVGRFSSSPPLFSLTTEYTSR